MSKGDYLFPYPESAVGASNISRKFAELAVLRSTCVLMCASHEQYCGALCLNKENPRSKSTLSCIILGKFTLLSK